jgi:hypothetical protein
MSNLSRRSFLKSSALGAAGSAFSFADAEPSPDGQTF